MWYLPARIYPVLPGLVHRQVTTERGKLTWFRSLLHTLLPFVSYPVTFGHFSHGMVIFSESNIFIQKEQEQLQPFLKNRFKQEHVLIMLKPEKTLMGFKTRGPSLRLKWSGP